MSQPERSDERPTPVEVTPVPAGKSTLSKILAWAALGLAAVHLLNPWFGIDFDNVPVIGNLDETAAVLILLGALRYLNIQLPDFIERWIAPSRQLPPSTDRDEG